MKLLKLIFGMVLLYSLQTLNARVSTEQTRMESSDKEKIQNMTQGRSIYGLRNKYSETGQFSANGVKPSSASDTKEARPPFYDSYQSRNNRDLMGATPNGYRPNLDRLAPAQGGTLK